MNVFDALSVGRLSLLAPMELLTEHEEHRRVTHDQGNKILGGVIFFDSGGERDCVGLGRFGLHASGAAESTQFCVARGRITWRIYIYVEADVYVYRVVACLECLLRKVIHA